MLSLYSSDMKYAFVSKKRRKRGDSLLKRSRSWTDWYTETEWGLCAAFFTGILIILAAIQFGFIPWFFWQFQSFCKLNWVFESHSCNEIQRTIMRQIESWDFNAQCWGYNAEGCKYKLLSVTRETLHAQHTTNYTTGTDVQDLAFHFIQEGDCCKVQASAVSLPNLGTLFTDVGCNYCTLRNLPRAAGLVPSETATRHECVWREVVTCVFETGTVVYQTPPHTQGIYENGRLISSMLVEGDDLVINIAKTDAQKKAEKEKQANKIITDNSGN